MLCEGSNGIMNIFRLIKITHFEMRWIWCNSSCTEPSNLTPNFSFGLFKTERAISAGWTFQKGTR